MQNVSKMNKIIKGTNWFKSNEVNNSYYMYDSQMR